MLGIVIAMESEGEILLSEMKIEKETSIHGKKIYIGVAFNKECVVCISGVGKVNAAIATEILILEYKANILLNFGVAGGLNKTTELTKVYEINAATQFDFDLTQLNGTKMGTLDEYSENYLPTTSLSLFEKRKLGTADRFNDSIFDYELLTNELNADIRDMEGAAIVQVAIKANLPIYLVKAISDVAGNGSTTEQFLINRDKALQNLKLELPNIFEKL